MEYPKGFRLSEDKDYVCRLNKTLYGLNQVPTGSGIQELTNTYAKKVSKDELQTIVST